MRTITSTDEYNQAKEELRELFNADTCHTDSKSAHELMRALDTYEARRCKKKCTEEERLRTAAKTI